MITDIRYALRVLTKNPAFTLVAVLTIALGVGANTALFSVIDAVLLRKLPVKDPDQLVLFKASWNTEKFGPGGFNGANKFDPETLMTVGTSFPLQTLTRFRQEQSVLADVFAFAPVEITLNAGGQAEVVSGQVVSGNYYSALGVPAHVGRTITDADDNAAATPVAVLSHRLWTTRFNSDPAIAGKQVNINNVAFTVAGVTPAGFAGTSEVGSTQDVTIPIAWEPQISGERTYLRGAGIWWLRLMGRLKPGATLAQAQAALAEPFQASVFEHRAGRQARATQPLPTLDPKDLPRLGVDSGSQGEMDLRRRLATPLRLLLGVVGVVLLIACANVANLLLARASARQKEIAVRLAMGASRTRLIRQLLTESILLATAGGALGVLFALWIKNGLFVVTEWAGPGMSALDPALNLRVLGFTLALSVVTGIAFGIMPALRATRFDLAPTLKDAARGSSLFGLVAQLLAAIGLYGVMAYGVVQRTKEIGIRMALGADRARVLRMILRQGMALTLVGVGLGLAAAYVLTKYLESLTSMLFGVEARDPWTFAAIGVLLIVVTLVACLVPARRATKVDPLVALRYE